MKKEIKPAARGNSQHRNGEHSRWCQKIKGKLIYCRFTDQLIGKLGK